MNYLTHYNSPIAPMTIASDGENIIGIWFDGQKNDRSTCQDDYSNCIMQSRDRDFPEMFGDTIEWLDAYFAGEQPKKLPKLKFEGTDFQKAVMKAMLAIPYGTTVTYAELGKEVAKILGKDKASAQAVGKAVGNNPLLVIVPCHRVIGANDNLKGYVAGINKKIALLELEKVNTKEFSVPKLAR